MNTQILYSNTKNTLMGTVCLIRYDNGEEEYSLVVVDMFSGRMESFGQLTSQQTAIDLVNAKLNY